MQWGKHTNTRDISPDEIFLDSSNLARLDGAQFEGRVERPISTAALSGVGVVFVFAVLIFLARAFDLQVLNGRVFADISRENRLSRSVVFAPRGIIYDRSGVALAWNEAASTTQGVEASTTAFRSSTSTESSALALPVRQYRSVGLSHTLGFVSYPRQDSSGEWWREEYEGVSGAERMYDATLHGENGSRLVETDARGVVQREHIIIPPVEGHDVTLTIDSIVQKKLFDLLSAHADAQGFAGGAGIIIDVKSGDLIALTSFPGYDNTLFAAGDSAVIDEANKSPRSPLLNRAVQGLYTPGSIVKPIFAAAALNEGIISPDKKILSTGQLVVPNPYDPSKPSIFRDWKAHGWVDMRKAIAVSSDQYFYAIAGGIPEQSGLGIERIDAYARAFGLGAPTGIPFASEAAGVIPTPEWKAEVFGPDEQWRLGDTYITGIGQFGFQITPLQAARYVAAIANGGTLVAPRLSVNSPLLESWNGAPNGKSVGVPDKFLEIVREGMRAAVHSDFPDRTARALDMGEIEIAGKTGTAQIGDHNQFMNSWAVGFWPASHPRYAFAVVLEHAPAGTLSGAAPAMQPFFYWLVKEKPEYVQ